MFQDIEEEVFTIGELKALLDTMPDDTEVRGCLQGEGLFVSSIRRSGRIHLVLEPLCSVDSGDVDFDEFDDADDMGVEYPGFN